MNLKKIKIIDVIGTFILCFFIHEAYNIFPNTLFSIFFPVNESVWEHMKMLYTAILAFGILEYTMLYKFNIKYNNFLFSLFTKAILSIPIYLVIFLPIYYKIGENMPVIFIIMLIDFIIVEFISYKILNMDKFKNLNLISIILIILCYITFGYLTYNPIKTHLFLDTMEEKYGINDFNI